MYVQNNIQGTFSVYEKLSHIMEFVQSCLKDEEFEFELLTPTGHKFSESDMDKTLFDLRCVLFFCSMFCTLLNFLLYYFRLVPNSLLTFVYESMLYPIGNYLKEDLLMLIQPV